MKARLNKLETTLTKDGRLSKLMRVGNEPEQVDADLVREQLEREVGNAVIRREISLAQSPQQATTEALLTALGYTADEAGRLEFSDKQRVFLAVRKHALELPHFCAEFCPTGDARVPQTEREHEFMRADVLRHLSWLRRAFGLPISVATVALYDYCDRRGSLGCRQLL